MPRLHTCLLFAIALLFVSTTLNCGEGKSDDSNQEEREPSAPLDDPNPNQDCAQLTPLRFLTSDPSAVVMSFTAEDCRTGEPLTQLDESAFIISENGSPLASTVPRRLTPNQGQRIYITLLLDLSAATIDSRSQLQQGTRRFVEELLVEQAFEDVYISIDAFDGSPTTTSLERPTQDAQKLLTAIDSLTDFAGPDPSSTNLYGALNQTVIDLQEHQKRVLQRNFDDLITTGHIVLFSASSDSVGREDRRNVRDTVEAARYAALDNDQPPINTVAVALDTPEQDTQALSQLVGGRQWISQTDLTELTDTFEHLAHQIAQRIQATYLLTYCSPGRTGWHFASVELATTNSNRLQFEFDADGFRSGCSAELFDPTTCDADACNPFCGACADETHSCAPDGRCVSNCLHEPSSCGEPQYVNSLGYTQSCQHTNLCKEQCIDTSNDNENCGDCDVKCHGQNSQCFDGQCIHCESDELICDGQCTESDRNNCGACGNICPDGSQCTDGSCICDGGGLACDDQCVDSDNDPDNCGACGVTCLHDSQCVAGECLCPTGLDYCDGRCVDLQSNPAHCGSCQNTCTMFVHCAAGNCVVDSHLSAGDTHACAIRANGELVCWGDDSHRGAIPPPGTFSQIDVSSNSCGIQTDGTAICWGQFLAFFDTKTLPDEYTQISLGGGIVCALKTNGRLACWANDFFDELNLPADTFSQVSVNDGNFCALRADGTLQCWGSNSAGESTPPPGTFSQVSVGASYACGIKSDGTITCWGDNHYGRTEPPDGTFYRLSAGTYHGCAIRTDGTVACWGADFDGEASPPEGEFSQVSAGSHFTCGIKTDGIIVCWGDNRSGRATPR